MRDEISAIALVLAIVVGVGGGYLAGVANQKTVTSTSVSTAMITTTANFQPKAIKILGFGQIVVVGNARINGQLQFAIVRYNSDGSLDTSFGGDGMVTNAIGGSSSVSSANAVAILIDNKILVAGASSTRKADGAYSYLLAAHDHF